MNITFYRVDLDSLGDRTEIETIELSDGSTQDFADLLKQRGYDTDPSVVFEVWAI